MLNLHIHRGKSYSSQKCYPRFIVLVRYSVWSQFLWRFGSSHFLWIFPHKTLVSVVRNQDHFVHRLTTFWKWIYILDMDMCGSHTNDDLFIGESSWLDGRYSIWTYGCHIQTMPWSVMIQVVLMDGFAYSLVIEHYMV